MQASADAMKSWWSETYLGTGTPLLAPRFQTEALASLPGITAAGVEDVHAAVELQRVRLRRNQGVP